MEDSKERVIKIVGQVVTEKMFFYHKISDLNKVQKVEKQWFEDLNLNEQRL